MSREAHYAVPEFYRSVCLLVETADASQREQLMLPFGDEVERRNWHFIPRRRQGVALSMMSERQRKQVHRILSSVLARHAHAQVAAIMALENILDVWEEGEWGRDALDYAVSVFGDPRSDGAWSWRFEGHHVSINVTVDSDVVVSATPLFLGSNPASIAYQGTDVVRPLPLEEELARRIVRGLSPDLRDQAVVRKTAAPEILTYNAPYVEHQLHPLGIAATDLPSSSRQLLSNLIDVYLDRVRSDLQSWGGAAKGGDESDLFFAWEGPLERGEPHYYRIQGPRLLIEYDNSQHGANHVHSVVRDPLRDFGGDPLRTHLREAHGVAVGRGHTTPPSSDTPDAAARRLPD